MSLCVLFLVVAGTPFFAATAAILVALGVLLVFARIVAEAGMPFVQLPWNSPFNTLLFTITGFSLPATALVPLALIGTTILADPREALLPYAVNADYLGHKTGRQPRRISLVILTTALLGGLIACLAMVYWFTASDGASTDLYPLNNLEASGLGQIADGLNLLATPNGAEQLAERRDQELLAYGLGAVIVAVLGVARMLFSWWSLHPIGFLLMGSYPMMKVWFSFLLGWLAKVVIMRYGGTGAYKSLKPLAIGLIAGEALAVVIFIIVAIIAEWQDVAIPAFKALPA